MSLKPISNHDLSEILNYSKSSLEKMRNKNIFITGATGFFGKWLMQALSASNDRLNLNIQITILTRNSDKALEEQPWLKNAHVKIIEGDICNFQFPSNNYDFFIHAATAASASLNQKYPEVMANTIVDGTRNILKLASQSTRPHFLFVSSGAVLGKQPPSVLRASEYLETAPLTTDVLNTYAEAKRMAEVYCQIYQSKKLIQLSIARCYAFVGPYLPLDQHFAAGNFIKNILERKTITLSGDGTPYRSYMYPTDLVEWLLTILTGEATGEVYNVGSDEEVQLIELAKIIDNFRDSIGISINEEGVKINDVSPPNPNRNAYVPSIEKAYRKLNLKVRVNLLEALQKTLEWNR